MFQNRRIALRINGGSGRRVRAARRERGRSELRRKIVAALCLGGTLVGTFTLNTAFAAQKQNRLSDFSKVENLVRWHFESRRDHSPGDILSRSIVEPVLKQLRLVGWAIPDQKSILNRVPRDDAYLVRQLRTTAGKKFMRNIQAYPLVYDRLDRLTGLAHGRLLLQDMIRAADGHEMMRQMTQEPTDKDIDKKNKKNGKPIDQDIDPSLARVRKSANFNKPTGRIYTTVHLLSALKTSYDRAFGQPSANAAK